MLQVFDHMLKRMSYRRQKRWWNAYMLFYCRADLDTPTETITAGIQVLTKGIVSGELDLYFFLNLYRVRVRIFCSVAVPDFLSRIPDPDFYPSRIPDLFMYSQYSQN
jgi:hypothetical protein